MNNTQLEAGLTGRDVSHELKVGFLYNHDELHQVAHTAPIISSLQRRCKLLHVDVLTTSDAQSVAVRRHLDAELVEPSFHALEPHRALDLLERLGGRIVPLGRIGRLSANLDLLGSYDALIVPETTSALLKARFGLKNTRLIFYPHGAGDRSISVSPEMRHFDFVLLPGNKTRDRMLSEEVIRPSDHAVVGYPKFDSKLAHNKRSLFANDKPTVLYNPHFDPKLSSWFKFGLPMLDHFVRQDRYNLIVAPHVMLFRRKLLASVEHRVIKWRREIPDRFRDAANIHIDEGSPSSVDMTYTRMADIYVGDVSSQIYEFIERPRPAIFLNSHIEDWQGLPSYAFWNFGPVIDDISDFDAALTIAQRQKKHFGARQARAFEETFGIDPEVSSADRAADAIADYLRREFPDKAIDS